MKNFFYLTAGTYFLFKVIGLLFQIGVAISMVLQYGTIKDVIIKMMGGIIK